MKLDHIVHFINRSPQEIVDHLSVMNIKAVKGGRHEKWGTYNSLLYLNSSYIEFLAIENKATAVQSENPLIQQAVQDLATFEGLGQVCFRTENIEVLKQELNEKGYKTYPIFPGERMRSDGQLIRWKMLFLQAKRKVPFPFFIQWEQDDHTRYEEFKTLGMIDQQLIHTKVKDIVYHVESPEETAEEWCELFQGKQQGTNVMIADVSFKFDAYNEKHACKNRPVYITLQPFLKNEKTIQLFGSSYHSL
ncbi:VOC family protein [Cytobacillus sp. Sa5YUA1]|uniref:VOC family protein n=1 Tax=Cytobacillus stercorigallinarum TaxID=2762240 RepID=A0ABR8QQM1_9BACI|nr:VOC family protein [Cytobacillus stercorigallinarum]MBD7937737.1 VOC family protein [Cytobacillus stercorigallinarum]